MFEIFDSIFVKTMRSKTQQKKFLIVCLVLLFLFFLSRLPFSAIVLLSIPLGTFLGMHDNLRYLLNRYVHSLEIENNLKPIPIEQARTEHCRACGIKDCQRQKKIMPRQLSHPAESVFVSRSLNKEIELFIQSMVAFSVDSWYKDLTDDDALQHQLYFHIQFILASLIHRVRACNLVSLITQDIIRCFRNHLQIGLQSWDTAVKSNPNADFEEIVNSMEEIFFAEMKSTHQFISTSSSRKQKTSYYRRCLDHLLPLVVHPAAKNSSLLYSLLREMLVSTVLETSLDMCSSRDFMLSRVQLIIDIVNDDSPNCFWVMDSRSIQLMSELVQGIDPTLQNKKSALFKRLPDVLVDPIMFQQFMSFLSKLNVLEYLTFVRAVEDFENFLIEAKTNPQSVKSPLDMQLRAKLVVNSMKDLAHCPETIEYSASAFEEKIEKNDIELTLFKKPYFQVYQILENKYFPMFLRSSNYFFSLTKLKGAGAKRPLLTRKIRNKEKRMSKANKLQIPSSRTSTASSPKLPRTPNDDSQVSNNFPSESTPPSSPDSAPYSPPTNSSTTTVNEQPSNDDNIEEKAIPSTNGDEIDILDVEDDEEDLEPEQLLSMQSSLDIDHESDLEESLFEDNLDDSIVDINMSDINLTSLVVKIDSPVVEQRSKGKKKVMVYPIHVIEDVSRNAPLGSPKLRSRADSIFDPSNGNAWTVSRRFKEFASLDRYLKSFYPDSSAQLPDKHMVNKNKERLEQRRKGLQLYLRSLLANTLLHSDSRCAQVLYLFLKDRDGFNAITRRTAATRVKQVVTLIPRKIIDTVERANVGTQMNTLFESFCVTQSDLEEERSLMLAMQAQIAQLQLENQENSKLSDEEEDLFSSSNCQSTDNSDDEENSKTESNQFEASQAFDNIIYILDTLFLGTSISSWICRGVLSTLDDNTTQSLSRTIDGIIGNMIIEYVNSPDCLLLISSLSESLFGTENEESEDETPSLDPTELQKQLLSLFKNTPIVSIIDETELENQIQGLITILCSKRMNLHLWHCILDAFMNQFTSTHEPCDTSKTE